MLSYTLSMKKATKKVATTNLHPKKTGQMLFNGLAHCGKLMLNNFPFTMNQPEISETMQLPIYLLTMPIYWLNRLVHHCIHSFKRGSNVHNSSSGNFSLSWDEHSHWNPWTSSAGNVLGLWWVKGLEWKASRKQSQSTASRLWEIISSHWPNRRRLKQSTLQSLPACNSLGAEVCQSIHFQGKHKWPFSGEIAAQEESLCHVRES